MRQVTNAGVAMTDAPRLPQEWQEALRAPIPDLKPSSVVIPFPADGFRAQPGRKVTVREVVIESGAVVLTLGIVVYALGGTAEQMISAGAGLSGGVMIGRLLSCNVLK